MSFSTIDLSTYVLVGRYDLPEPTRTVAPANSLLAQEVPAVTYNWDTGTLFVVGDGTSVVQVTLTGQLINSIMLAPGSSPQGSLPGHGLVQPGRADLRRRRQVRDDRGCRGLQQTTCTSDFFLL